MKEDLVDLKTINYNNDTIVAPITQQGGAISMIRISGPSSFKIIKSIFSKNIQNIESHTIHFGSILDDKKIVDEVLVYVFKNPKSYTKEDTIEISCHGSKYIVSKIIELIIQKGARIAQPGEFTKRAFLNGQLDLSQAEAVADLIASNSEHSHNIALKQLKGRLKNRINFFREKLINFISLLELELDFSEEDVEFAERNKIKGLLSDIIEEIFQILSSFKLGNAFKEGIPIAIVGKPNAGKSSLLNILLGESRAIVTNIPGTTRDPIEDTININGAIFRLIDTAGLRKTKNEIEKLGIDLTYDKTKDSDLILYLVDVLKFDPKDIEKHIKEFKLKDQKIIMAINKYDLIQQNKKYKSIKDNILNNQFLKKFNPIFISSKTGHNISLLKSLMYKLLIQKNNKDGIIINNLRHYENFKKALNALYNTQNALKANLTTELLVSEIKNATVCLGHITGSEITNDEILDNIFSKFCIGK